MWGEFSDLPFALACVREPEHVPDNERRAIELMRSLCDVERFNYYVATGLMFARGNITGITYRLEHGKGHGAGVCELEDGQTVASWCIQPTEDVPSTDHVLALKNLIEGEEAVFRSTGNRSSRRGELRSHHHHDEGTFRNIAAPREQPSWETSICGTQDEIETRDVLGVMVYRDTYFQPEGAMTDKFAVKGNEDLLTAPFVYVCDLDFQPHKPTVYPEPFDGISMRVCRTNDLYRNYDPVNYPGPRADAANAIERFNHALRIGGMAIGISIPDMMGLCLNNAGASYHQGFADGMDAARPRRQPLPPSIHYDPIFDNPNQIGIGVNGAGQWNPIYAGNTLTCITGNATYPYAVTHNRDAPGERAETDFDRLAYADELAKIQMTEPQDDLQTDKWKRAMEVEL